MTLGRTLIIVNPTAGSGRARRAAEMLASRLPHSELATTNGPGDAVHLARAASQSGVDVVVAAGGDGTIQQCVTGLCLDDGGRPASGKRPRLSLLPAGTGGDFRRTFSMSNSLDQAESRLLNQRPIPIDIGLVTYQSDAGPATTTFANVLTFGLGGLTDRLVERSPKWVGGRVAFFSAAVRANLIMQTVPIELRLDGEVVETANFSNVAVCNARFCGGGMKMAPEADPQDGLFDVITFEKSKLGMMTLSSAIYGGTHVSRAGVKHYRCRTLEARVTRPGESLLDVDGEQPGSLPITVRMLPGALELLT